MHKRQFFGVVFKKGQQYLAKVIEGFKYSSNPKPLTPHPKPCTARPERGHPSSLEALLELGTLRALGRAGRVALPALPNQYFRGCATQGPAPLQSETSPQ